MFRDSGKLSYFPMSVNVFDSAVFLGLMTASVVIFSSLSKNQLMKNAKMILTGIAILILLNLFFVSGIGFLIREKVPEESMDVILWIMRGVSVVMPVLLWFFLKDGFQFTLWCHSRESGNPPFGKRLTELAPKAQGDNVSW